MDNEDLKYWLALSFIQDIGPVTCKRLLAAFHHPKNIFEAGIKDLADIETVKNSRVKKIKDFNEWNKVQQEISMIQRHQVQIVTFSDKEYPEPLRQIDDSPIIIYTKGRYEEHDSNAIAIVGSRMMSDYGGLVAERIAFDLASLGITIVSGMARGIDTASHKGALSAGGRSIAVLGCGIDRPYPSENARLLKSLTHSGCVISEFPMGTPPNKEHFPRRNRLISGLSSGVLVVEAAVESGSLITAQYALEQGKEVFAVPGNITSKTSEGTNALIQSGAKLVQRVEDILEELPHHFRERLALSGKTAHDVRDRMSHGLAFSDEEKAICTVLSSDPKHIDSLVRETNIPAARLLGILLSLEMKGIVRQAEGKRFHLR